MAGQGALIRAVVVAFASIGAARAGDLDGFYAGLNGGLGFGRASARTTTVFSQTAYFARTSVPAIAQAGDQDLQDTTLDGGVQAGFNASFRSLLFGLEADVGIMDWEDRDSRTEIYPCCAPTTFTITQSVSTDWLFTARPRVGYTYRTGLLYATGGLAVTKLHYRATFTDTFADANEGLAFGDTVRGWAYGGGVEVKVHERGSLRLEYLHLQFDARTRTSTNFTAFNPRISFATNVFTHRFDLKADLVRVGASYFF